MRSNIQKTNSNRAAKAIKMMKTIAGGVQKGAGEAAKLLTSGATARQWTACVMICAMMMSSVFALPVRRAISIKDLDAIIQSAGQYGSVNDSVLFPKQILLDLNANAEAWLAPLRKVSDFYKDTDDKAVDDKKAVTDKDNSKPAEPSPREILEKSVKTIDIKIGNENKIKAGQTISLAATLKDDKGKAVNGIAPSWTSSNSDIIKINDDSNAVALKAGEASIKAVVGNVEKEIKLKVGIDENESNAKTLKNSRSALSLKAAGMLTSLEPELADRPILADAELVELVSPRNNLGSPMGQTEASSGTPPAAMSSIGERAGIGNFSFGVPLASLPGRGMNASVGMSYNSQIWTKSASQYTFNVDGNWLAPGFQIGYGYLDDYNSSGQLPAQLILTGTNGTRHQMTQTSNLSGRAVYETNDGSFIKGDAIYDGNFVIISLTITYTDGTKITYGGPNVQGRRYPVRITDIHGNYISINYLANDKVGKIASIKDTLGRDIVFNYDSSAEQKLIAITVPGYDNSLTPRQTVRFYYETLTLNTAGRFDKTVVAPASETVLRFVYFPGTRTGYRYDYSSYGMMYKITQLQEMGVTGEADLTQMGAVTPGSYLESATTTYDYPGSAVKPETPVLNDVPKYENRTDDWIGRDTTAPAPVTRYFPNKQVDTAGIGTNTMTVTSPNGTQNVSVSKVSPGAWDDGLTSEIYVTSPVRTVPWSRTVITWEPQTSTTTGRRNPQVQKTVTYNEVNQANANTFAYDNYGNRTIDREFDFSAAGEETTELRRTEIAYETGADYISNRLFRLPKSVKKFVGGAVVSRTDLQYDQYPLTDRANIVQYDQAYNPNNSQNYDSSHNARGNVTTITTFINPTNDPINPSSPNDSVTGVKYDIAGNQTEATLNCCNLKTWTYDNTNGAYAFQISETKGSDVQLKTSATFDFNTGLPKTTTDENNQVTNYEYEPDTLRMKKVLFPNSGYTQTEYSDKLPSDPYRLGAGFVKTTTTLEANKTVRSYSYFDGRGAAIRGATETPDGWSVAATEYDSIGRPKKTYNPFYGATPIAVVPGDVKWTEVSVYDNLDRVAEVKLQDSTTVNTYYNEEAVTYTVPGYPAARSGTATRVKDQAGKERRQIVDALGRVVRLDEPDTINNSLGGATAPVQPTHYFYDGNDNLTKVVQSDGNVTQERRFQYDSLSRLTHEKQVEADATLDIHGGKGAADPATKWTKVLKYNAHGLLTDGIDARGVNTHFDYDGLNRIWKVKFSDDTPKITYVYDQAKPGYYNNGALTRVETAQNDTNPRADTPDTATEFDYDQMGRVKAHRQSIGAQTYNLEYGYNLAGQLTSEKYPSGKVVSIDYDAGGRLSGINDASRTYLNNLQYRGTGNSLSSMSLGNGTTQSFVINDRLQMASQTLARGAEVLQKYDYDYGVDVNGIRKNNGQLAEVVSHIGTNKQWTQKFNYDSVGRLSDASEYRGDNNALSYKQTFDYDRFGNMYRKQASNSAAGQQNPLPYNPIEDGDISKTTNRFTTNTAYDEAGNVIQDAKFRSSNYSYDANGRMFRTSNFYNTNQASSVYDASGNRVATKVQGIWTYFIYDAFGKMVAEYSDSSSTNNGGVKYVMQDWQGSTRAIVGQDGLVKSRTDYTAFGEEINAGVGQRTTAQGFDANNNLNQKYALTERDKATGLDHTWFRKNENRAGRWTSPDPYNGSMSLGNPQSFNRYSYVENQPTNFVDPSGLIRLVERPDLSALLSLFLGGLERELVMPVTVGDPFTGGGGGGGGSVGSTPNEGVSAGLSDCAKKLLKKFFPKLNLDAINLTLGLPDGAPSTTTSDKPVGGMVFGNTIYTSSQSNFESRLGATWGALKFLAHEITHVDQYRRLGIVGFGIGYTVEGFFQAMTVPASRALAASYDANAFETRASNNASRIISQLRREGATPCPVEGGNLATVTVNG